MRRGVWWLLLGTLAGGALVTSGGASAGHLSSDARGQAMKVELPPDEPTIDREPHATEGSGDVETESHSDRETVATQVAEELGHVSHELDDLAQTMLGNAERLAVRLMQGTRTGATEVHHAYLVVTTTLTSLGRCFEEGVASSPFGPAGPRAPDPPSGSAGTDDPCDLAGRGNAGPEAIRHTTAQEESDPDGSSDGADLRAVTGGDTP
jgi:hypothetical protein